MGAAMTGWLAPGSQSGRISLLANVAGRVWVLTANVVMFPVYLRVLGSEHFGVVAVLASITAIVALFDFGLTPVFARELNNQGRTAQCRLDLLHSAERVFLTIVLLVAGATWLAPDEWLAALVNAPASGSETIAGALRLVFGVATAQLMLNFYIGALSGIEAQVQSNLLNVGTSVVRSVGVLLPLMLLRPGIDTFLWWQVGVTCLGVLLSRQVLYRLLNATGNMLQAKFSGVGLRRHLPAARDSFLLATAATLNMNLDKIFVGKIEGLSRIAEYMIAATFAQLIFIATVPLTMTAMPRLVRAATSNDPRAFDRLLTTTRTAIGIATAALVVVLMWHGPALIQLWSGGAVEANQVQRYSGWLFLGAASLAVSSIYHCVATAHMDFSFGRIYVYSLLLVVPAYWVAIAHNGVAGAAMAWGCAQLLIALAYREWVNRRWLRGQVLRATPLVGLAVGGGATAAVCALLSTWAAGTDALPALLLVVSVELILSGSLCLLVLVLLSRSFGIDDGLAKRADAWTRNLLRNSAAL